MKEKLRMTVPLYIICACLFLTGCIQRPDLESAVMVWAAESAAPSPFPLYTERLENCVLSKQTEPSFAPVSLILQNPALPNGCEVTSLAMVLTAAGYTADHVELYETSLQTEDFSYAGRERYGPDPDEVYIGNAASRTDGWYCFETPIVEAGNDWIQRSDGNTEMRTVSGLSQTELEAFVQNDIPVVVWVTIDYEAPTYADYFTWLLPSGQRYMPYNNLHCVVLAGEEDGGYRIADPISGWQTVDKDAFWYSFDAMGRRAVILTTSEPQPVIIETNL